MLDELLEVLDFTAGGDCHDGILEFHPPCVTTFYLRYGVCWELLWRRKQLTMGELLQGDLDKSIGQGLEFLHSRVHIIAILGGMGLLVRLLLLQRGRTTREDHYLFASLYSRAVAGWPLWGWLLLAEEGLSNFAFF